MNRRVLLNKAGRWLAARTVMIILLLALLWGAYTLGKRAAPEVARDQPDQQGVEDTEEVWTCPMHPQIRMPEEDECPICGMALVLEETEQMPSHTHEQAKEAEPAGYACSMFCVPPLENPGKCPVCGMDMVAVYDEPAAEDAVERRLVMSNEARALADIQTAPVLQQHASRELRLVGIIEPDETRLARVTAYVGGRLDQLHVRFTGAQVERGAPLAGLYSPDLLMARAELLQAKQSAARLVDSPLAGVADTAERTVRAARERLRLWGLSEAQIRALESGNDTNAVITIPAPISGTVLERHVQQGDYVETGSLMFTVADLSTMWIQIKAYESDLDGIVPGLSVQFSVDALPGETFEGNVAFVDPWLDAATRTVNVRVEVDNSDGRLKPGMFARAQMDIPVAAQEDEAPLLIPATAPLLTGTRAVAYVEAPGRDRPTFEGRQIRLGPRAGEYYVVKEGLHKDERVVVKGAFRIDSALQIRSRPSMMQPEVLDQEDHGQIPDHDASDEEDEAIKHPDDHESLKLDARTVGVLQDVLAAYIATQQALAADDLDGGLKGYASLLETIRESGVLTAGQEADGFPECCVMNLNAMDKAAREVSETTDIEEARRHFEPVSDALITLLDAHSDWVESEVSKVYCPMAFDDAGASWLQRGETVRNPYFGASMLQCGVVRQRYGTQEGQHE